MPEIQQYAGKIVLILAGGPDKALLQRVRGWRIWSEAHIYYQLAPEDEGAPAVERVELVANAEMALVVREAVFGSTRSQGYHHARAGPPPSQEGSGASLGSRRRSPPTPDQNRR